MPGAKRQKPEEGGKKHVLSRRKRFCFALVASLLPVLFFVAAEMALRFFGLGGYSPMFRVLGPVKGGNLVMAVQGGAASWFIGNAERAGTSEQYTFLDPKPSNTFRIFLVGESAIQGYPQPRHLSASAFLQAMLRDAWPYRKTEVINLGTTAVASFPVLGVLTEALKYKPDLVVIYVGNNEFFGTYGVASVGWAGSRPWMLRLNRELNSLALVQGLHLLLRKPTSTVNRTLMEEMMAQQSIAPDSWHRRAAANNLHANISQMIVRCQKRGVNVLVCAPPTNERDLAPIGNSASRLSEQSQAEISPLLAIGEADAHSHPDRAISALRRVLELDPKNAHAHYVLGQAFAAQNKTPEALGHFILARDYDTMPWRNTSLCLDAIVSASREHNAPVCDLVAAFRSNSPNQSIGWELMDDHVHPTLRGQGLIAEELVKSIQENNLGMSAAERSRVKHWEDYAARLGTNVFDEFAVARNMRSVFSAEFMRRNNAQAFARYDRKAEEIERQFAPEIREVLGEWETSQPYAGSRCPVTAAVAQLFLKEDKYREALGLYETSLRAVPPYTAWYLEYLYYALFCRTKINSGLSPVDLQRAHAGIEQGHFLAAHVAYDIEFTKRFTGLLHLLCAEYNEAIPWFVAVRSQQKGIDLLALDQALLVCYINSGKFALARELLQSGSEKNTEFAGQYRAMAGQLSEMEKAFEKSTSSGSLPKN